MISGLMYFQTVAENLVCSKTEIRASIFSYDHSQHGVWVAKDALSSDTNIQVHNKYHPPETLFSCCHFIAVWDVRVLMLPRRVIKCITDPRWTNPIRNNPKYCFCCCSFITVTVEVHDWGGNYVLHNLGMFQSNNNNKTSRNPISSL